MEKVKDEDRDAAGLRFAETFAKDVRYGLRTLRKSPGYTAVAILTLALGIGANTAMFSVVNGVLLQPLPYRDGEELILVRQQGPLAGRNNIAFSVKEIMDYRDHLQTLDGFVEHHGMSFTLLNRGEPDRVLTGVVSSNFFDVLGVTPLLGRTFLDTDDDLGAEAVLILSYPYWQQKFGGDPAIVGQVFEMNDRPHTVVGVLPPIPQYPRENDVYMPTSACPFRARGEARMHENRSAFRAMTAFGRLGPGTTLDGFGAELSTVANRFQQDFPETYPADWGYTAIPIPLFEELTRDARPMMLILLGTSGLVLLIACANVANLTLARMMRRERELGVRAAMGAGRGRLLQQLLTESTLLAVAGGAVGLLVAWRGLDVLVSFATLFTPRTSQIAIDGWVLGFTLGVSILTGLVFGAVPAFSLGHHVVTALKEGGAQTTDARARHRLRSVLIVGQVAVSFVLLIGAGLLLTSFYKLQRVDPGFNPENVLTAEAFPNWSTSPESHFQLLRDLLERIESRPGVVSAAVANSLPMIGERFSDRFEIEGRFHEDPDLRPEFEGRVASPDYFETVGVPLLAGRTFTNLDDEAAPAVVVISRSLARRHWGDESPVGQRITIDRCPGPNCPSRDEGEAWITIVGVVGDVKHHGLDSDPAAELYRPFLQTGAASRVLVRTRANPMVMAAQVRDAVHEIDPEQPVENFRTLEEVRSGTLATPRLTAILLGLFATLALLITLTGITGVIATSVSQRTREFGIRMALGAQRRTLLGVVMRQGLSLVLLGLALGVVGALGLSRVLAGLLFETEPTDPLTFLGVSLAFIAAGLAACFVPARRAMTVDPMVALRSE